MAFHRRWLLILALLILGGGNLFAASREDRAFAIAAADFKDGIYDRAETELADFVDRFPDSPRVPEAVLMQAQAQYQLGKYDKAINQLTSPKIIPGNLADRFAYWQGEAEFARGDFPKSAEAFEALVKSFPQSPLRLTALVEAAASYERLGDWPQMTNLLGAANSIFSRFAAQTPTNEVVARGWLLLARAQLAQESYPAALATLQRMEATNLPPSLAWQWVNLQCRILAGAGDLEAALATTTNLIELARAQDAWRLADSVAWRGTVLERLGRWSEAASVWAGNLTNTAPAEWQREAVLRIANAALTQKKFSEAETALDDYVAKYPAADAADFARLMLGELHLREYVVNPLATNELPQAVSGFNRLIADTNNPSAVALWGRVFLDRGWCNWLTGDMTNCFEDFYAATQRLPYSQDLAVAKFKTGDALFELRRYADARAAYQGLLDQFAGVAPVESALGSRALYQILRANLALTNAAGAESAMAQLLQKFPTADLADDSQLLLGEAYSDWGQTTNALKTLDQFATLFPDSPLMPQVEMAKSRALERAQDWTAAVANYEQWLKSFPTNSLRPQAEYALGRASFMAGNETNAFATFTNFVATYPTNVELAPLAQWWVGDYFFRQGGANFSEAEKNYEMIFQNPAWQKSPLYYPAQLMAARSAMGRGSYSDAANYLTQLLNDTNCPAPLRTETRFALGGLLMRMDSPDTNRPTYNFEQATNLFTKLWLDNATNDLGALALERLGDCDLQLGDFDGATNAYAQVLSTPSATMRCRAWVGIGRTLEKKAEVATSEARIGLLAAARNSYLNAFEMGEGRDLAEGETVDAFWVKKAGLLALPLLTAEGTYPTNFFTRMERLLPSLKATLEKKQAALKN